MNQSPNYAVAVNVSKGRPETWPRWRYDNHVAIELRPFAPMRVPRHVGITLIKKFRQVRYMLPDQFKAKFGYKPPILIGRSMGIGDILMLEPSLRALAAEGWAVHFACMKASTRQDFTDLVRYHPKLERVLTCSANKMPEGVDIAAKVNLNMKVEIMKGAQWRTPRSLLFSQLLGVTIRKKHPLLKLNPAWNRKAARLIPEGAIGVCVETSSEHRNYMHTDALVEELANRGHKVVLLHHAKVCNVKHENVIDLQGVLTVGQLCAVIKRCAAVVSPDSGPMHIAMTLRTPVVAIEGPTPPAVYHWNYEKSPKRVLQKDLKCKGCWHRGKFAQCIEHGYHDHECMDWPVEEVADAAEEMAGVREMAGATA
jgi:ADP-heptose:LPS heptosyltransferase